MARPERAGTGGLLESWLYSVWYGRGRFGWLLLPLSWLFRAIAALRRAAYRVGLVRAERAGAPVIIVGNITVGGSGKTPLVGWLAEEAVRQGFSPAIVSRGYGGSEPTVPLQITSTTPVADSGDEPLMLHRQTGLPVFVCRHRAAAAKAAVSAGADLVIADDGLQHYALHRDAEIVIVDADRVLGNGRCLPAGPLREPKSRLRDVDLVLYRGGVSNPDRYDLTVTEAVNAVTGERRELESFIETELVAIAGIGHPQRFFETLRAARLEFAQRAPGDHGRVDLSSIPNQTAVLMTAKDAVKYTPPDARIWVVQAEVEMPDATRETLVGIMNRLRKEEGDAG